MIVKIHDYPTRLQVSSESDSRETYLVDISHPKVVLLDGRVVPNGTCQCMHYVCYLHKKLGQPTNREAHRCKHINAAREFFLDFMVLECDKRDPNIKEEHQT